MGSEESGSEEERAPLFAEYQNQCLEFQEINLELMRATLSVYTVLAQRWQVLMAVEDFLEPDRYQPYPVLKPGTDKGEAVSKYFDDLYETLAAVEHPFRRCLDNLVSNS